MSEPSPRRMHLRQILRYLAVGAFNTGFGFCVFVSLNYLFRRLGVLGSEMASLLASVISITVAFLGYKWFVFRTRGNYLREWLRCLSVYGTSMGFTLLMLPPLTLLLKRRFHSTQLASNIAAAMLTVVTVVASYFGHKYFSFRRTGGDALDAVLEHSEEKAVQSRP